MIQVIDRAFRILEELSRDGEVSLQTFAGIMKLNKGTLCNILRTMIDLGYVRRSRGSHYQLTERFQELAMPSIYQTEQLQKFQIAVNTLAEKTGESGVLAELRHDKVSILCQAQYQQMLMVNAYVVYANLSLYHSVTGRVLVAYLSAEQRKSLFRRTGAPGADWDNIETLDQLEKECAQIRKTGLSIMANPEAGIIAFAVPVTLHGPDKILSLGMTVPLLRCKSGKKKALLDALNKHAELLGK